MALIDKSPSYVRAISPYVPGKPVTELAREMAIPVEKIIKLASNENPLGMSPKGRAAVAHAINGIERYPDNFELTQTLATRHGVDFAQIVLGNGSNDILDLAARAFITPGTSAVYSQYAFAVYPLATRTAGGECIEVPAKDYGHDLPAMLAAIRPDTRIVWLANPNNPTGSFVPHAEMEAFLRAVPQDVLVVLDEAYNEYLPPALRFDTLSWVKQFPNLLVTRTFSKIYGLAGLRIGFAVTRPEVAGLLNRVRQPFNVNNLALAAALAAIDDDLFLAESYELNRAGIEQITAGLTKLGLTYIPTHCNFVAMHVPNAANVNQRLLQQGVIVRPLAGYAMPEHLRVTIGLEHENARFLEALAQALGR